MTKAREFWIREGKDEDVFVSKISPEFYEIGTWFQVREILPTEPDYKKIAGELVDAIKKSKKIYHTEDCYKLLDKALAKAREAGLSE